MSILHWRVPADDVARCYPPGTRPDEFDGSSWVGLVAFRMARFRDRPRAGAAVHRRLPRDQRAALHGRRRRPARRAVPVARGVAGAHRARRADRDERAVPVGADVAATGPATSLDYRSTRLTGTRPSSRIVVRPSSRTGRRRPARRLPHRPVGDAHRDPRADPVRARTSTSRGRCVGPSWCRWTTSSSPPAGVPVDRSAGVGPVLPGRARAVRGPARAGRAETLALRAVASGQGEARDPTPRPADLRREPPRHHLRAVLRPGVRLRVHAGQPPDGRGRTVRSACSRR